ncbi:hypothetical protein L596_019494 [Steinernema carpocapsae]|uniref:PHD-type domain-containing protein n=1 Tax=Steinernema carpocapsae TaxID=34508 RepID=A0A4U5MQN8_STECR|nr:hypothetical protein L596_019494 [Steinernema carpocapsae]
MNLPPDDPPAAAEEDPTKILYCVCRKPDDGKLMVACDKCGEWFHGACVGFTRLMNDVKADFFCYKCKLPKKKRACVEQYQKKKISSRLEDALRKKLFVAEETSKKKKASRAEERRPAEGERHSTRGVRNRNEEDDIAALVEKIRNADKEQLQTLRYQYDEIKDEVARIHGNRPDADFLATATSITFEEFIEFAKGYQA